jgi:hypothetical protein
MVHGLPLGNQRPDVRVFAHPGATLQFSRPSIKSTRPISDTRFAELWVARRQLDLRRLNNSGAAAYASKGLELMAGGNRDVGVGHIELASRRATPAVIHVLRRFPAAPPGGGRIGELLRDLDQVLRRRL